jgi:hypothetical protein
MNAGMAMLADLSDLTAECRNGKCSWEPYTTLALCSTVEDISSTVNVSVSNTNSTWKANFTVPAIDASKNTSNLAGYPGYSLFWAYATTGSYLKTLFDQVDDMNTNMTQLKVSEAYLVYLPPCDIINQTRPTRPYDWSPSAPRANASLWRVYKATFSVCLQTLESSVQNGRTVTRKLESDLKPEWHVKHTIANANTKGDDTTYFTDFGLNKERFSIDFASIHSLRILLSSFITGNSSGYDVQESTHSSIWEAGLVADVLGANPDTCLFKSDGTKGFAGWKKRIQSLADSATNT